MVVEELVTDQGNNERIVEKGKRIKTKGLQKKFKQKSSSDVLNANIQETESQELQTSPGVITSNQNDGLIVETTIEKPLDSVHKSKQKTDTSKSIKRKTTVKGDGNENPTEEQEDQPQKQDEEINKETMETKLVEFSNVDASPEDKMPKKKIMKKPPKQAHVADKKIVDDPTEDIIPNTIENNIHPDYKSYDDTKFDKKNATLDQNNVSISQKEISDTEKDNTLEVPKEIEESAFSSSSEFSRSSYSSNDESVTDKMSKNYIIDKKVRNLKKKRARRDTEKVSDDQVDESSEVEPMVKPTSANKEVVALLAETTDDKIESIEQKKAKSKLSVEEKIRSQKTKKNDGVKDAVFEKPKLKKAERIQRDLPKQKLEEVDLKKHKLEQLALHEMVIEYLLKYY